MNISQAHKADIEKIMSQTTCAKKFKCVQENFENLCGTKFTPDGKFLFCPNCEFSHICEFKIPFGDMYLCTCTMHKYAVAEIGCCHT